MIATIVPTQIDHLKRISKTLSAHSRMEIEKVGFDQEEALALAIASSISCWTGLVDGEIVCVWGLSPQSILSNSAHLWMVTTPLVEAHSFLFARQSQILLEQIKENYDELGGFVDPKYSRSIRWLKWLGFEIDSPQPYVDLGMLCRFHIRRH